MVDRLAVGVIAAGLVAAYLGARSGKSEKSEESLLVLSDDFGPFPSVLFFTSSDCVNCGPARTVVEDEAGNFLKEIRFQDQPGLFERMSLDGVPTVLIVAENGTVVGKLEGALEAGDVVKLLPKLRVG